MKPSVSLITLGVSDYARQGVLRGDWLVARDGRDDTAFFQANGVVLVLWSREKLATDRGISDDGASWGGIALAHNVASDEEVGRVIEEAPKSAASRRRTPGSGLPRTAR